MANQMTKAQLVTAIAERTGGDKKAASGMLDALTGIITETVSQGGAVTLPGVGKITCHERPERMSELGAVETPLDLDALHREADMLVAKVPAVTGSGAGRPGRTRRHEG